MEYKKLISTLESIKDFYKNDGHFVSETNGKEEIKAIEMAKQIIILNEKYLKKWGKNV
jgi:hypothetical protein